jgi:hypothetical protein
MSNVVEVANERVTAQDQPVEKLNVDRDCRPSAIDALRIAHFSAGCSGALFCLAVP